MSVFLAWMPDDATVGALRGLRGMLASGAKLAWRDDAQLHMTLRYLGQDASDGDLVALDARLAGVVARHAATDITFDRLERWSDESILVVRTQSSPPLQALFADLERAATDCGFPADPKPPLPHVTLARARRGERIGNAAGEAAPGWLPIVATIGCIQRVRTVRGGYEPLASWPLPGGVPDTAPCASRAQHGTRR